MKKSLLLALVLMLVCIFAFSACSVITDNQDPDSGDKDTQQITQQPTEKPTEDDQPSDWPSEWPTGCQHIYGEWVVIKEATCTESGKREKTCSVCLDKQTETISALGHNVADNVCIKCGRKASEGLGYTLNSDNESYSVSYIGSCTDTDIIIPSTYNGKPVTSIGDYAFDGCTSLTSITIPDSVTSIGEWAFLDCTSLTSVTIPDSVTSIGSHAFYYCSRLTSVTIGNGVTSIGNSAFSGCSSLTSVTIGNGVTSIGEEAFFDCYKLVEVYDLSSLDITKGSSSNGYVGYYALVIHTSANEPSNVFTDDDGYIFYENGDTCYLLGYKGTDTDLTLPENCNGKNYSIYQYAFYYCSSLTSVTIPDSVTSIGEGAFAGCSSLTSVTIPDSVTSIGEWAFLDCTSLTSVTIPDSVTSIGDGAFEDCTSLTSVTFGDNSQLTSIGNRAFEYCSSLASINFSGTKEQWNDISKGSYWNGYTGDYTIYCMDGDISK